MDKFGTVGLFLVAICSPCCFPLFAFAASALGFGSFELFGGWTIWIFKAMVLVSVAGLYSSYRVHGYLYPLLTAAVSALLIFYAFHIDQSEDLNYAVYIGMFGLLMATIWNYKSNKTYKTCNSCTPGNDKAVQRQSTLTCPNCGFQKAELMPDDACVYFYECKQCKTLLKPLQGDCCVYCSYGSLQCPPVQAGQK